MAKIHPSFPLFGFTSVGAYRERDVLQQLADGLPDAYDIFHNVEWPEVWDGRQHFGEVDLIVVAPSGHVMLVEVKSGEVEQEDNRFFKIYGGQRKDIDQQIQRQFSNILRKLQHHHMPQVQLHTMLVLPDHRVQGGTMAHSRTSIVDATDMPDLCRRIKEGINPQALSGEDRAQVMAFLGNALEIKLDVATRIGQTQSESHRLAAGLATWVPRVQHEGGVYVIDATAGSGKTQLALDLLNQARDQGLRAAYFCYNRPLADHMIRVAPPQTEAMTFHEKAREVYAQARGEPDFSQADIFQAMEAHFVQASEGMNPRWDLLIVDESQDFQAEWMQALVSLARDHARIYIMGDRAQRVYKREPFAIDTAVRITCMDNFRTPRAIVDDINTMQLTPEPIVARSAIHGHGVTMHTYDPLREDGLAAVDAAVQAMLDEGFQAKDIVVLSFHGIQSGAAFKQDAIANLSVRKFTGQYNATGEAVFTAGDIWVESVYRFKGQSAPAIVFCDIDFTSMDQKAKAQLFVGMTRAQMRLDMVISKGAVDALLADHG